MEISEIAKQAAEWRRNECEIYEVIEPRHENPLVLFECATEADAVHAIECHNAATAKLREESATSRLLSGQVSGTWHVKNQPGLWSVIFDEHDNEVGRAYWKNDRDAIVSAHNQQLAHQQPSPPADGLAVASASTPDVEKIVQEAATWLPYSPNGGGYAQAVLIIRSALAQARAPLVDALEACMVLFSRGEHPALEAKVFAALTGTENK